MGVPWRQECEYARWWGVAGSAGDFVCPTFPEVARLILGSGP